MSLSVTTAHVQEYKTGITMLAQQMEPRFRRACRVETVTGKNAFFDQIGIGSALDKTSRHSDVTYSDLLHARRRVTPTLSYYSVLLDTDDMARLINDPRGSYARAAVYTLNRKLDAKFIAAIGGTAYTGEDGSTATTLPSAQKVAVASTGLTKAKLLSAAEILNAADVDPAIPRYVAYNAKMLTTLLGTTEVASIDYNTVKALVDGTVKSWLGCEFIPTQLLGVDGSSSRLAYMWAQEGMLLGIAQDLNVQISQIPTKHYSWQIYVSQDCNATRMQEKMVAEIACAE